MSNIKDTIIFNWFDQVWNNNKPERMSAFLTEDILAHGATPDGTTHGIKEYMKFYNSFREQFSDIHVKVECVIKENDMEAALCHVTAKYNASNQTVNFS